MSDYLSYATLNSLGKFSFIAGNSYLLEFSVYDDTGVNPVDLGGASVVWLLCPFGQPDFNVLEIIGDITGLNTFEIDISNEDTESLSGTFIHQPVITAFTGEVYKPAQGTILILPAIARS